MLIDRVRAAAALYRAGRVDKVLVSGDHGRVGYDEVGTMRRALWLARRAGLHATGLAADARGYGRIERILELREVVARVKAVTDVVTGAAPRFLGPVHPDHRRRAHDAGLIGRSVGRDRRAVGGQRHVDVAARRVGVRADTVRRLHQRDRLLGVLHRGQCHVELDGQLEAALLGGQQAHAGLDGRIVDGEPFAPGCDPERAFEARRVPDREELLGVGPAAVAAHLARGPQVDLERAVVRAAVALRAAAGDMGARRVQSPVRHGAGPYRSRARTNLDDAPESWRKCVIVRAFSDLMRRLFDSALGHDLRLCPVCRQPFVAPREILASHEDGHHVVDLACSNCEWSAIQLHDAARLTALDEALDRDSAQIEAAAQALALSLELDRIDRFAAALHAGHILPEDF
jgi:hypothetical protein